MATTVRHDAPQQARELPSPSRLLFQAVDRGWIPDAAIRWGIRSMLEARLKDEAARVQDGLAKAFHDSLATAPLAINTDAANEQHYEIPAEFFGATLGPHRKYSCCLYDNTAATLGDAERAMLDLTISRAEIVDGMHLLDLGCGWGSLSLYLAERFPSARITGVSNSRSQRDYITDTARARGLENLRIITADMNNFVAPGSYDRIVSIEMFEHLRNHARMLQRIADWLRPGGKLFVHIFCHREHCYPYEERGPGDWMARHFFTGGMMPSFGLIPALDRDLRTEDTWQVNGLHYHRTCMDWLANLDAAREEALEALKVPFGADAPVWLQRWRIFFLACAELFAFNGGNEWFVAHYRLTRA